MRADFVLDYDVLTVEHPQRLYLMARMTADPAPSSNQRRPLNLSLVIDRSGSMAGDKIAYTVNSAQFLVRNLGARDIFSVVLYSDGVEVLLEPEIVKHKDAINQRIGRIKAQGTTNLSGGWLEGFNLIARNLSGDYINRVILMSDGHANRGITEVSKLVNIAEQKRGDGITTTAMGLGEGFNEDLLTALANAGGGAFYFIESPEVAPLIFQEELQELLGVVGQNLTITLILTEHVDDVQQLNAYPVTRNSTYVEFRLGDVVGDEVKTLILSLSVPAMRELGTRQIATLRFAYDELIETGTQHHVVEVPVMINVSQQAPDEPNPEVIQPVLLLKAAQARREAVDSADKSDFKRAAETLRMVADEIGNSSVQNDALREEREALLRQATEMERGADAYDMYQRKSMHTQAIYTMSGKHENTITFRRREAERQMSKVNSGNGVPTEVSWRGQVFTLNRDLIRVGRAPQNEIVVDVQGVSRFHCQIKHEGDQLILEDLGSTNGTLVNGTRVTQAQPLYAGDEVTLSGETLVFQNTSQQ